MTKTTTQLTKALNRQQFTGKVVSSKMKDTTVIEVKSYVKHAKYGKFMNKKIKIMAHDVGNTKKEGDTATVEACRPISKRKAFKVVA